MTTSLRNIVEEFERLRGAPLSLEDKLRLSIAENERKRTVAHEDLYAEIRKRREACETEIKQLQEERDTYLARVNEQIREKRAALEKLPRPPINRPKKTTTPSEGETEQIVEALNRGEFKTELLPGEEVDFTKPLTGLR